MQDRRELGSDTFCSCAGGRRRHAVISPSPELEKCFGGSEHKYSDVSTRHSKRVCHAKTHMGWSKRFKSHILHVTLSSSHPKQATNQGTGLILAPSNSPPHQLTIPRKKKNSTLISRILTSTFRTLPITDPPSFTQRNFGGHKIYS